MQIHPAEFSDFFSSFKGGTLFCGFSGGADSTAALLVTCMAAQQCHFAVTAIHVNHHLRGAESDREAVEAENFCRARGIPFQNFDLTYQPGESQDENALREKRLAIWQKLVSESPPPAAVVLGHHVDDAAENLLLKWGRGGNVSSLTAPAAKSTLGGVTLLRPLFDHNRAEIEEFLRREGVTRWAEDSSNEDNTHCLRNRLRLTILPQLYALHPGFREGVRQSLEALRSDAECLDELAARQLTQWQRKYPDGVPASELLKQPEALRFRVVKIWTGATDFSRAAMAGLEKMLRLPETPETRRFPIFSAGKMLLLKEGMLRFSEERTPLTPQRWCWRKTSQCRVGKWVFRATLTLAQLPLAADLNAACFDADALPEEVVIGSLLAGEKMVPFDRQREVSVKKLRTDRHLTAAEAPPALRLADGTILWAPRIRHSAYFPVTGKTQNVVKFALQAIP